MGFVSITDYSSLIKQSKKSEKSLSLVSSDFNLLKLPVTLIYLQFILT